MKMLLNPNAGIIWHTYARLPITTPLMTWTDFKENADEIMEGVVAQYLTRDD